MPTKLCNAICRCIFFSFTISRPHFGRGRLHRPAECGLLLLHQINSGYKSSPDVSLIIANGGDLEAGHIEHAVTSVPEASLLPPGPTAPGAAAHTPQGLAGSPRPLPPKQSHRVSSQEVGSPHRPPTFLCRKALGSFNLTWQVSGTLADPGEKESKVWRAQGWGPAFKDTASCMLTL